MKLNLLEVIKYRKQGFTSQQIADKFGVSISIYEKFVAKNKTNIPKKLTKKKVRFQVATTQESDIIVGIPKVFQEKVKNFNHNEMLNQKNSFVHNFNIEIIIPIPIIEENYSILKIKNILLQNKIIKSGINTPHKILRYLYQYCIMDNLCILHYPCRKDI